MGSHSPAERIGQGTLSTSRSGNHRMLFVLGQVVGDREPGRLRADENVLARADSWIVDESSHGDVNKGAGSDERIEE
jgi:hypothetical protein